MNTEIQGGPEATSLGAKILIAAVVLLALGASIYLFVAVGQGPGVLEGDGDPPRARETPADPVTSADEIRFPDGTARRRPEFEVVADMLAREDETFFGRGRAAALRASRTGLEPEAYVARTFEIVHQQLREGETEAAVAEVDALFAALDQQPALESNAALHRLRGLANLRLAEVRNCVERHNADCCIVPIRDGGIHRDDGPARAALDAYLTALRIEPDNLRFKWLANIASMTLGEWPEGLPAEHRLLGEFAIPPAADVPRFRDVAAEFGVNAFNLCGGCVVDDIDGDGLLDIVTSTIDPRGPMVYYRQDEDGGFEDRSAASRLDDQLGGLNVIGGDYDNDGDLDLLVLRGAWLFDLGRIRNSLLRNDDGVFTDVTFQAGLGEPAMPTQAAAWADFDLDGDLDLFVGNESRAEFPPEQRGEGDYPSQLFRNNGDGTFTDVARDAGVTNDRYCKGVTVGDYDNDGDIDLYVSNIGPNRLFRNETTTGNIRFTDMAPSLGVTEPADRSFATWFFDYDNDGWLDLFVTAYDAEVEDVAAYSMGLPFRATAPRLYRNRRDGTFEDVTAAAGLDRPFLPMGANFGDLDNDGWLDMYLTTGAPSYESIMPNVMLRSRDGASFDDVTGPTGFGHLQKGHGVAFADIDEDGDQDVYHQLGGFYPGDGFRNALFRNPGNGAAQLTIELNGTPSNRMGYGARIAVEVERPDGTTRMIHRAVGSVSSFGGSPRRQEIGVGDAVRISSIEVQWPSQTVERFEDVPIGARIQITEGEGGFRVVER